MALRRLCVHALRRKQAGGRYQSTRRVDAAEECGFFTGGAPDWHGKAAAGGQRRRRTGKDRGNEKFRVRAFSFIVFSQPNHSGSLLDVGPAQTFASGQKIE